MFWRQFHPNFVVFFCVPEHGCEWCIHWKKYFTASRVVAFVAPHHSSTVTLWIRWTSTKDIQFAYKEAQSCSPRCLESSWFGLQVGVCKVWAEWWGPGMNVCWSFGFMQMSRIFKLIREQLSLYGCTWLQSSLARNVTFSVHTHTRTLVHSYLYGDWLHVHVYNVTVLLWFFFAMSCLAITDLQWRGLDLCVLVDTWNSSLGYGNLRQIHHGLLMPIAQFLGFLPEGSWVSPRPSLCRFDLQPWKPGPSCTGVPGTPWRCQTLSCGVLDESSSLLLRVVASRATSSDSCFNLFLINVIPDSARTASSRSTMRTGTLLCHWFILVSYSDPAWKILCGGSSRHVYYHLIVGSYLSGVFFSWAHGCQWRKCFYGKLFKKCWPCCGLPKPDPIEDPIETNPLEPGTWHTPLAEEWARISTIDGTVAQRQLCHQAVGCWTLTLRRLPVQSTTQTRRASE